MESASCEVEEDEAGAVGGERWGTGGEEEEGGGRGGRGMSILPPADLVSVGSGGSGISGRAVPLPAGAKANTATY